MNKDYQTMRPFLIPTLCALAALASGCDGDSSVHISSSSDSDPDAKGVLKVVETLQCPRTMGSLTRKGSATEEGRVCTYVGPKGAEVILHLLPLEDERPVDVLKAFETRLSASLPRAVAGLRAAEANAARAEAQAERAQAEADRAQARAEEASARAEAAASRGDRASVSMPGVNVEAEGEKASVRLPGMRIEADGDNASVRIGGLHIDADDRSGTVDIQSDEGGDNVSIRAQDDATEVRANASGDATRASWILTDNRPSEDGWRLVGYEARGPAGGPLVVATVRSRDRTRGRVFEDAKDLVELNVGD